MSKSFTIIELLVVIAIIAIIAVIVFPNYKSGQREFALERSAHQLAQDIRRLQQMAMSAEEYPPGSGSVPEKGYGIFFDKNDANLKNKKYILYADQGGNEFYNPGVDDEIEIISLETGVIIKEILIESISRSKGHINFSPPDPEVKIKFDRDTDDKAGIEITLGLENDEAKTKTIRVNKAGLISISN